MTSTASAQKKEWSEKKSWLADDEIFGPINGSAMENFARK